MHQNADPGRGQPDLRGDDQDKRLHSCNRLLLRGAIRGFRLIFHALDCVHLISVAVVLIDIWLVAGLPHHRPPDLFLPEISAPASMQETATARRPALPVYYSSRSYALPGSLLRHVADVRPEEPPAVPPGRLDTGASALGALVVVTNLPGLAANQLCLTGSVLAAIYRGEIRRWDDPQVQALNPGLRLPPLVIAPLYRADGSIANLVFTTYLSAVSAAWRDHVAAAASLSWPTGTGARGAGSVVSMLRLVTGSIGFVEYAVAARQGLVTARLQNNAGRFVAPDQRSLAAAAQYAEWGSDAGQAVRLVDQPCAACWPIVAAPPLLRPPGLANPAGMSHEMKLREWRLDNGGVPGDTGE